MNVFRVIKVTTAIIGLFFTAAAVQAQEQVGDVWISEEGLYAVQIESELSPIAINQIHSWTLTINDSSGLPVTDAEVSFDGGMPEHNHGLATSPSVTSNGDGTYQLQGLRFHMMGYWELVLTIANGEESDTALVTLNL